MATDVQRAYDSLLQLYREMALVASAHDLLEWDELTFLPDAAAEHRGRQIAWLAGRQHLLATDPRMGEWLATLEASPLVADPQADAAVNIREARWHYDRLTRLPQALVEERARVVSIAQHQWKLSREQSDFALLCPWLTRIVELKREEARCLADGDNLYDALLADYEPALRAADLTRIFAELTGELSLLLIEVVEMQRRSPVAIRPEIARRDFPEAGQEALFAELAAAVGFDLRRGAMSLAVHPFTTILGPHDFRLATRYDRRDLREGLFGGLHELGHILYDQGLASEHYGMPLGEAASLGVHESQGRLWENSVGRTRQFWHWLMPRLKQHFPATLADADADDLWRAINFVQPSVNRVRADEITYNLHIQLRFELEQALLTGDLPAADLPTAWNDRHRQLLGIAPATDREGCLQDGHWASGMFGYFPTYTLGNLLAAQLFARAQVDIGGLAESFARGDFRPLREWLAANLYCHGKRFRTRELIQRATGQPLDHRPFVAGLRTRHRELWSA